MESTKRYKSAMITTELAISLVLVIVILFVTLGLFSDNIKGMVANGNFQNIFKGGGLRTVFSAFNKDYSGSQVNIMVMSQQGLEVLRKKANDAAYSLISSGNIDGNALAYYVAVMKIIDGITGSDSVNIFNANGTLAYTATTSGASVSVFKTDGTAISTVATTTNTKISDTAYNDSKSKSMAIAQLTSNNANISSLALVQEIKSFTTVVASTTVSGGGTSTAVSSAESAIVAMITGDIKKNINAAISTCSVSGDTSAFCTDLKNGYTDTLLNSYTSALIAKYAATDELGKLISGPSQDTTAYWASWKLTQASNASDTAIAKADSSTLIADSSDEPIVAGSSDALIIKSSNSSSGNAEDVSSVYSGIDNTLLASATIAVPNAGVTYKSLIGGAYGSVGNMAYTGYQSTTCSWLNTTGVSLWDSRIGGPVGFCNPSGTTQVLKTVDSAAEAQIERLYAVDSRDDHRKDMMASYSVALNYAWELLKAYGFFELFSEDTGRYNSGWDGYNWRNTTIGTPICTSVKNDFRQLATKYGAVDMNYVIDYDSNGCKEP